MEEVELIPALIGFVIPLLVGLLAKLNASGGLKSVLNLGLSALTAVLSEVIPGEPLEWRTLAVTFILTWVTSIATYYGLWKPTHTAEVVQLKTANVGVGSRSSPGSLAA